MNHTMHSGSGTEPAEGRRRTARGVVRLALLVVTLVTAALVVAACGGDGAGYTSASSAGSATPSALPSSSPSADPSATATPSPAASESRIAAGDFVPVAHAADGTAELWQTAGGGYELRLRAFSVDDGPDLFVWLVDDPRPNDNDAVLDAEYVNAGVLKATSGTQKYALPRGFDPDGYRAVVIWCKEFSENFAYASLR